MQRLMTMLAAAALAAVLWSPHVGAEPRTKTRAIRPDVELVVSVAAKGLGGQFRSVRDRDDRIRLLRDFVESVRFFPGDTGYFFVYDTTGVCVAHGVAPHLVGRSLIDYRDATGFAVIRAIVDKGLAGGGFVEYNWEKPDKPGTHEKLGYVMPIKGTEFIIGSGIYFLENK